MPLHRGGNSAAAGAAQFWLSAAPVRAELAAHDDRLWLQAAIAWAAGSCVIVVGVAWAFRRLAAANRQLAARTADLERANRELVLSAKTSALGAVAAHLVHELKHPIAGLEQIVAGRGAGSDGGSEQATASELTRRLRVMVNEAELEAALRRRGFLIARPERMDALAQVALMRDADVVVGASGAALANAMFLKPGARVVDLGAAPGGWTQVSVERVRGGTVVGIDLTPVEPIAGATVLTRDFYDEDAPALLTNLLGGPADVVLSDMAASATGDTQVDHLRIMGLAEAAHDFARQVLKPGGTFVAKVLRGGTERTLLDRLKKAVK